MSTKTTQSRRKIQVGDTFGKLTTAEYLGCRNGHTPIWRCACTCGATKDVMAHHLRSNNPRGDTRSCGCLKKELMQGDTITCKTCGVEKSADLFYLKGGGSTTRHNVCRTCLAPFYNTQKKERNLANKLRAFRHYSASDTPFCACCSESHIEFLTMDHIGGGGAEHREQLGNGSGVLHQWLVKNNFPDGFQVLCMNCNISLGAFGFCPHKNTAPPHGWVAGKRVINVYTPKVSPT